MKTPLTFFLWILNVIAALIMLQTLFFKFSAAPESVYIFIKVGIEPWGRIATGIVELIASVLILIPRTAWLGALIAIGTMAGAIVSHLLLLGIDVMGDGGQLFYMALITLICSLIVLITEREAALKFMNHYLLKR
jgi:uncharacterized membrane protein YphA (DoxX/SURF4 family)